MGAVATTNGDGSSTRQGSTRALVALLAFILGFATIPHRVCEREASDWWDHDRQKTQALAEGVLRWVDEGDLDPRHFATGGARFDGEWLFATYMMGAMGFGQAALAARDATDEVYARENVARMERCLDAMLEPNVRTFDVRAWGDDALNTLDEPSDARDRGHVAYLGYAALPLALHRLLVPHETSRWTTVEERIVTALARRIDASPIGLLETYPDEVYPVDNTAALAALAVHARVTGAAAPPALARALEAIRARAIDPDTGLLRQAVRFEDGSPTDAPRASGTALGSYFLSFADLALSKDLFRALEKRQFRTVLGFGGVMEYAQGQRPRADVDSGPIVLGFGISASGFAIGASRVHGDRDMFTALYATAHLFGAPLDENGARTYTTGGPIGDAILFAMLTAQRGAS